MTIMVFVHLDCFTIALSGNSISLWRSPL